MSQSEKSLHNGIRVVACCRVGVNEADIFRFWLMHYGAHVDAMAVLIVNEPGDDISALRDLCQSTGSTEVPEGVDRRIARRERVLLILPGEEDRSRHHDAYGLP